MRGLRLGLSGGLALWFGWAGCGAPVPRTRTALDASRLELAAMLRAEVRAPEFWAEVEAARSRAMAAPDPARASDEMAVARLWLEAAIAECQRADLAAQRLAVERDIDDLSVRTTQDVRAAARLEADAQHAAATRIALDAASKALERAAMSPSRRPKLSRAGETEAVLALLTRAELVLGAARMLEVGEPALAAVAEQAARARRELAGRPDVALELSDRTLFSALALLGPVRARRGDVSDAERQALMDELQLQGGRVARNDRGLSIELDRVFGPGRQVPATSSRRLARLCSLSAAHPHGGLQVLASAPNAATASARREALRAALPRVGCDGARMAFDAREGPGPDLEITWLAY